MRLPPRFDEFDHRCHLAPASSSRAARLLGEVYASAVKVRPRAWATTSEELARAAERDPLARDGLLLYAAAVARDRGDHAKANEILGRALAAVDPVDEAMTQEFELQVVLAEALLRGDAHGARTRFARLGSHAVVSYPRLAEAAVLLAEGSRDDAATALEAWTAAAASSAPGMGRLRVGNEWAIDLIEERLGRRPAGGAHDERERLSALARVGHVLVGSVFVAGFGALTLAVAFGAARDIHTPRSRLGLAVTFALGFALIAAYGATMVVRGARGVRGVRWGSPRHGLMDRCTSAILAQVERLPHPPGLFVTLLLAIGWIACGSLSRFMLLDGPVPAWIAWHLLALTVVFWSHVLIHEAGHAACALAVGARIDEIAIGGLKLVRRGGAFRFDRTCDWLAAHVAAFPRTRKLAALRYAVFVAGGPAASLAVGVACLLALNGTSVSHRAAANLLWMGGIFGVLMCLLSLLPSQFTRIRGVVDGDHIRKLVAGAFWYTSVGLEVASAIATGVRARDWTATAEEIERAAAAARHDETSGLFAALVRTLDGPNPTGARRLASRLLAENLDQMLRREVLLQSVMIEALVTHDASTARSILAQARTLGADRYTKLAEAAVLLAEGHTDQARDALDAWNAGIERGGNAAFVRVGNHWALDVIVDSLVGVRRAAEG